MAASSRPSPWSTAAAASSRSSPCRRQRRARARPRPRAGSARGRRPGDVVAHRELGDPSTHSSRMCLTAKRRSASSSSTGARCTGCDVARPRLGEGAKRYESRGGGHSIVVSVMRPSKYSGSTRKQVHNLASSYAVTFRFPATICETVDLETPSSDARSSCNQPRARRSRSISAPKR